MEPLHSNLCDSQYTENRNNPPKSHLSVKRISVTSFTPNSSPCVRQGKKKKKPERKLAATWKLNHWKNVSLLRSAWLGRLGKFRNQKGQHVLVFRSPSPWFGKNLYHFFLFCFWLVGFFCLGELFGHVCLFACFCKSSIED